MQIIEKQAEPTEKCAIRFNPNANTSQIGCAYAVVAAEGQIDSDRIWRF